MYTRSQYGKCNAPYNYSEFILDNENDISFLPTSTSVGHSDGVEVSACSIGSIAYVINQRKVYILNNENVWRLLVDYGGNAIQDNII